MALLARTKVSAAAPSAEANALSLSAAQSWATDPAARVGYMRRLLAGLIDLTLALLIVIFALGIAIQLEWVAPQGGDGRDFLLLLVMALILGAVSAASMCSVRQATLGKRLLGLMVTDLNGQRLDFWRGYRRFGLKLLSYGLAALGWLPMFFGTRRQAMHDRLSGTLVLRRLRRRSH
jgi:uncharacterized RDD family membrane protein YckC